MVAVIGEGESISNSFYYNEHKVNQGVATLIHAHNYPRETADLTEEMRLNMLVKLAALNKTTRVNSLHISLNFDPSEKFPKDKLIAIARDYMEGIGFGNQPYLIYQHFDAGHPHIHLVTTNIQATGKAINLHLLGKLKSDPTRKAIEIAHGLIRAQDQPPLNYELKSAYSAKVIYGKSESRKAIAGVLNHVLKSYKYSSLSELNAVLGLYNILADRGTEESRIFKNDGLVYRILDEKGTPIGVPIKASSFYQKPTLKFLREQFIPNEKDKGKLKNKTKNAIQYVLKTPGPLKLFQFSDALKKQGIQTVFWTNKQGVIYGLTYVDHTNKVVFNGSKLGPEFSAKAVLERCGEQQVPASLNPSTPAKEKRTTIAAPGKPVRWFPNSPIKNPQYIDTVRGILQELMHPEDSYDQLPYELTGRKKKKKKKQSTT